MHEAKTHLSRLVERAAQGVSFIIAKAGKPLVKVVPLAAGRRSGPQSPSAHWPERFSADTARLIDDPQAIAWLSVASLWEVAIKRALRAERERFSIPTAGASPVRPASRQWRCRR